MPDVSGRAEPAAISGNAFSSFSVKVINSFIHSFINWKSQLELVGLWCRRFTVSQTLGSVSLIVSQDPNTLRQTPTACN